MSTRAARSIMPSMHHKSHPEEHAVTVSQTTPTQSAITVSTGLTAGGFKMNHAEGIVVSTSLTAGCGCDPGIRLNHGEGIVVSTPISAGCGCDPGVRLNHGEGIVGSAAAAGRSTTRRTSPAAAIRRAAVAVSAIAVLGGAAAAPASADFSLPGKPELTRTYRGADNSALYTNAISTKRVIGFGEHPGTGMAYVIDAEVQGTQLVGKWWDVPKGSRAPRKGVLSLTIAAGGSTLIRTGGNDLGPDAFAAIAAGDPYAGEKPAGFQATVANDLDGAFDGVAGRSYVRDTDDGIVWVNEHEWYGKTDRVEVFIGTRGTNGRFYGTWAGVPKGGITGWGTFSAQQSPTDRSFVVNAAHIDWDPYISNARYTPDYAVDFDAFASNLDAALKDNVVGYSYAIAHKGKVVRGDAGGLRNVAQNLPFTETTQNEIASTTKTVTAVAVARALAQRGLTLDTKVAPFLPAAWEKGPGMETVTFKQMLRHSGLAHPGSICGTDPYECLKRAVKLGMTATPGYNNIHFTLMRVVLPFIIDSTSTKDAFDELDPETDGAALNQVFSDAFRNYVLGMLENEGVTADFWYTSSNQALGYFFGPPISGGILPQQTHLTTGSGGLKITAREYIEFLSAFDRGEFVGKNVVAAMKFDRVGFDNQAKDRKLTGALGDAIGKNGATDYVQSESMIYPSDVQAFVTMNSANMGSVWDKLRDAYNAALI